MSVPHRYSNHNYHHHHYLLFLAILLLIIVVPAISGDSEGEILIQFSKSFQKNDAFAKWDPNVPPCDKNTDTPNWPNVFCENGLVFGLQLEGKGLSGKIDMDGLKDLHNFRTISVMNNNIEGPLSNLNKLAGLKTAYFSNNKFSGQIENSAFEGMHWLKKLHLSNNQFTGKIPSVWGQLPKLTELRLENNKFEGQIPDFNQERLMDMNFSNNSLEGPIPRGLANLKPSAFEGKIFVHFHLSWVGYISFFKSSSAIEYISILKPRCYLLTFMMHVTFFVFQNSNYANLTNILKCDSSSR